MESLSKLHKLDIAQEDLSLADIYIRPSRVSITRICSQTSNTFITFKWHLRDFIKTKTGPAPYKIRPVWLQLTQIIREKSCYKDYIQQLQSGPKLK